MTLAIFQPDQDVALGDEPSSNRSLAPLAICIWIMMLFTISAPEDWKGDLYGTASILPPTFIKLLKLVSRVTCYAILGLSLLNCLRLRNSAAVLLAFAPMILFFVWSTASCVWSPLFTVSVQQVLSFGVIVLLAFVVSLRCRDERGLSCLLFHVCAALLMISFGLLLLYFVAPQYGTLTKQSSGMFHSTSAGASASLGMILVIVGSVVFRWSWATWMSVPAVLIHTPALLLAGNRFSIALTLVLAAIVLFVFLPRRALAWMLVGVAMLGSAFLCLDPKLNALDPVASRVEEFTRQGQSTVQLKSLSGRSEMWDEVWRSFQRSPWIGHGYFVTSETGRIHVWDEWGNWTAHNIYLQLLVTTGVVGGSLFLIGVGVAALAAVFRDPSSPGMAYLVLIVFAWFAAWGCLNASIIGPMQPESTVFAVIYGIAISLTICAFSRHRAEGVAS